MTVTYRCGISIFQLIVYVPALVASVIIASRHGFSRNAGWYFLVIFSMFRIASSIAFIVFSESPSTSSVTAAAILSSIGISPLLLASFGILSRGLESITRSRNGNALVPPMVTRLIGLLTIVGLILGIVGGSSSANSSDPTQVNHLTKVAIILFVVAFGGLCALTLLTGAHLGLVEAGERRLVFAVAFSLPFLAVRIAYSMAAAFLGPSSKFGLLTGSVTIWLVMEVLEEMIVVLAYLIVGLTVQRLPRTTAQAGQAGGRYSGVRGMFGGNSNAQAQRNQAIDLEARQAGVAK